MKQREWIARARDWFASLPEAQLVHDRERLWEQFAAQEKPVLTIFGSYDTGKSALLRRLLVDDDVAVPDWLTISAKPETEKVSEIRALGCVIRDTPGISTRSDARSALHNSASFSAIGITDAALLIVNPQLATEEVDALRRILQQDWPSGALIFVIGRFDVAGGDPEYNPDGYQDLMERKERELRSLFALADDVSVFVVSQDPYGMAGTSTNPDPTIWDEHRGWDGMGRLAVEIERLSGTEIKVFRDSAEARFWHASLAEARDNLALQMGQHERAKDLAAQIANRRASWLDQLDAIDKAARAAAEGEVHEAVRGALAAQAPDPEAIRREIKSSLNLWWKRNVTELELLLKGMDATLDRQEDRPGWEFLESLVIRLGTGSSETPAGEDGSGRAEDVTALAGKMLEALKVYNATVRESAAAATRRKQIGAGVKAAIQRGKGQQRAFDMDAAIAAAPQAIDALGQISGFFDEWQRIRAVDRGRRERAEWVSTEVGRIASATVREAMPHWKSIVQDARAAITSATQGEVDALKSLEELIPRARVWIDGADGLLQTATE